MSEWKENTGTVPEGVTATTSVEVEYADGAVLLWSAWDNVGANNDPVEYVYGAVPLRLATNDDPELWTIDRTSTDVIRWRFVDDQ